MKLTPTQVAALAKLDGTPRSGYDLRVPLPTLRALVAKGYALDVTPRGPGALFSPTTHFKFIRKD